MLIVAGVFLMIKIAEMCFLSQSNEGTKEIKVYIL